MKIRDERLIEDKNEEINLFFLNPEKTKREKSLSITNGKVRSDGTN
jgi:hypothetical protein